MIRIEINTDNAAFDGYNGYLETVRMLRDIADRVESGSLGTERGYHQGIRDINGNFVGSFAVLTEE